MQAERYISNDPDEIIAIEMPNKGLIFLSRLMLIIVLIGFFKDYKIHKNEPFEWIIFTLFALILVLISSIKNKKIQFIINKNGFWTKKHDFILWEDVWYFYIREQEFRNSIYNPNYQLKFKLKENDKVITIKFEDINYDIENIQKRIRLYTKNFNIHDLGYEKESYR